MPLDVEYTLSNGRKVKFQVEKARVIDQSETTNSVTSSGRRHIQSVDGRLISTPGAIETELVTTSKVWVMKEGEKEALVDISDFAVPVRVNHEIVLLREIRNGKLENYMGMENRTTGQSNIGLEISLENQRKYGGGRPKGTGKKIMLLGPLVFSMLVWIFSSVDFMTSLAFYFPGIIVAAVFFVIFQFVMGEKWAKIMDEVRDKGHEALSAA